MKRFFDVVLGVFVSTLFFFGVQFLYAAWSAPTAIPTGNNVDAPINVGAVAQGRMGRLGVGTMTPDNMLDVQGTLEVGVGTRGALLTSSVGDNFQLYTYTNTPNPNLAIGYGNGAGGMDLSKEYLSMNAGVFNFANGKIKMSSQTTKDDSLNTVMTKSYLSTCQVCIQCSQKDEQGPTAWRDAAESCQWVGEGYSAWNETPEGGDEETGGLRCRTKFTCGLR